MNKEIAPITAGYSIAPAQHTEVPTVSEREAEIKNLVENPTRDSILGLACAFELEKDPGLRIEIINGIARHKNLLSEDDLESVRGKASEDELFHIRFVAERVLAKAS